MYIIHKRIYKKQYIEVHMIMRLSSRWCFYLQMNDNNDALMGGFLKPMLSSLHQQADS